MSSYECEVCASWMRDFGVPVVSAPSPARLRLCRFCLPVGATKEVDTGSRVSTGEAAAPANSISACASFLSIPTSKDTLSQFRRFIKDRKSPAQGQLSVEIIACRSERDMKKRIAIPRLMEERTHSPSQSCAACIALFWKNRSFMPIGTQ
jgi:hypothetical protein